MKNPNPFEKEIEAKVREYAMKHHKCLCYKFTSPSSRSVPDRVFVTPTGVVFWIEFKMRGKLPTAAQSVELAKLKMSGANVFVCDSVDEGKGIVDQMILKGY